jgi:hypothetical protein
LAGVKRGERATQLVGLDQQLVESLLNVVTNAIDQRGCSCS